MPSLACFEVAHPLIAGQVSVDYGASLPLGGPLVLTLPSLPRNACLRLRLCLRGADSSTATSPPRSGRVRDAVDPVEAGGADGGRLLPAAQ